MQNIERYSILSSSPLLPPFSQQGENAPFPSFTKKGEGVQKSHKTLSASGPQDIQKRHIYSRQIDTHYTHTSMGTYGSVESTENRPQAPQTQAKTSTSQEAMIREGDEEERSGGRAIHGEGGRIVVMPEPLSSHPSAVEEGGGAEGGAGERQAGQERNQ